MPLQLKMPHPDAWLAPALEEHIYGTDSRPYDDAGLSAIVEATVPVIAAATLEAAAELVETIGAQAPPLSGGQWLQALAEQCRNGTAYVGDTLPVTINGAPPTLARTLLDTERERDNLAREVRRLEGLLRERKRAPWWRRMGGAR